MLFFLNSKFILLALSNAETSFLLIIGIIEMSYGATEIGHFMISFFSSYLASIIAPTSRETPIPYDPILTKSFFPPDKSTDASIGLEYLSPK